MTYIKRNPLKPMLSHGEFVKTEEMSKILEELDNQLDSYDAIVHGISENLKFIALHVYGANTDDAEVKSKIKTKINEVWGKLPKKLDYTSTGGV